MSKSRHDSSHAQSFMIDSIIRHVPCGLSRKSIEVPNVVIVIITLCVSALLSRADVLTFPPPPRRSPPRNRTNPVRCGIGAPHRGHTRPLPRCCGGSCGWAYRDTAFGISPFFSASLKNVAPRMLFRSSRITGLPLYSRCRVRAGKLAHQNACQQD